jgi:hypothetical protein
MAPCGPNLRELGGVEKGKRRGEKLRKGRGCEG